MKVHPKRAEGSVLLYRQCDYGQRRRGKNLRKSRRSQRDRGCYRRKKDSMEGIFRRQEGVPIKKNSAPSFDRTVGRKIFLNNQG